MRKIDKNYENFLDNLFIDISEYISPFFKCLNFTANDITSLSLLFGLIAVYLLYTNNFIYCAISYLISYLFDVMDGYYARKYNITSKFGDLYDHIKDIFIGILLYSLLLYKVNKYNKEYLFVYIIIIIISFILCNIYLGCQENIYLGCKDNKVNKVNNDNINDNNKIKNDNVNNDNNDKNNNDNNKINNNKDNNDNNKINNDNVNTFLNLHRNMCKNNPKSKILFYKYFGCGSFILIICVLIISLQCKYKK